MCYQFFFKSFYRASGVNKLFGFFFSIVFSVYTYSLTVFINTCIHDIFLFYSPKIYTSQNLDHRFNCFFYYIYFKILQIIPSSYKSIIIIPCTLSNSPHAILRLLYINLQIFTFFKVLSYMAL